MSYVTTASFRTAPGRFDITHELRQQAGQDSTVPGRHNDIREGSSSLSSRSSGLHSVICPMRQTGRVRGSGVSNRSELTVTPPPRFVQPQRLRSSAEGCTASFCWRKLLGNDLSDSVLALRENYEVSMRVHRHWSPLLILQLSLIPFGRELPSGRSLLKSGKSPGSRVSCFNTSGADAASRSNSSFSFLHSIIGGEFRSNCRISFWELGVEPLAFPSASIWIVPSVNSKNGSDID